jgi:hypothetical protein
LLSLEIPEGRFALTRSGEKIKFFGVVKLVDGEDLFKRLERKVTDCSSRESFIESYKHGSDCCSFSLIVLARSEEAIAIVYFFNNRS